MGVIEIEGLRKTYRGLRRGRTVALDGLDLEVPEGGVFGFLGPNGAGKTTTIRCLLGLVRPDGGRMRILGREIMVGAFNGVAIWALVAGVAWIWFQQPMLSVTIGLAVFINLLAAALAGTLVPLALDRLDRDPAVSSPVFVTWITDSVGFFAFLGLAGLILL